MTIDITSENVVTLTEAAKLLPPRRRGKRPNLATMYRWTKSGCRGVVLESVQVGGTRCTSREALSRFVERLTDRAAVGDTASNPGGRSLAERRRADEKAARSLEKLGL